MGRVLLASMNAAQAARRVQGMLRPQLTSDTLIDASEILKRVQRCREDGYATSDGELEVGVRSMAVPVCDRTGSFVGAMSIAVRAERMTMTEVRETFLPALQRARDTLASRLFAQ